MSGKKVGVFGGTFNPIHIGHLRSAEEVGELLALDKVLFVPSFNPPLKQRNLISFGHRMKMVEIAVKNNPLFDVSDVESRIPGKSYTVYTLKALMRNYSSSRLFFIMGADAFLDIPKWFEPGRLFDLADIVVMLRPPFDAEKLGESRFLKGLDKEKLRTAGLKNKSVFSLAPRSGKLIVSRVTPMDISATAIRKMIKKGKSVRYLLPQKVESYIISNGLYS